MGKIDSVTYWSLDQYADAAEKHVNKWRGDTRATWCGTPNWASAVKLARMGWNEDQDAILELAESAVQTAEQEHMVDTFTPVWDVAGAEVDVARYLSGEPECMIDFPLTKTSRSGRVITMCASVCYSGSIEPDTIRRRGRVITALALALSRLGHSTELWADISSSNFKGGTLHMRILVKGANDELDPSRIMFAYAHPSMLRRLGFGVKEQFGEKYDPSKCCPAPPAEDLPEGTIYLPEIYSDRDVPNADEFLREHLGNLGLLAD